VSSRAHTLTGGVLMLLMLAGIAKAASEGKSNAWTPGGEWEGYNKTLDGQRYSPLTELNTTNVSTLSPICRVQIAARGAFEAGPVVVGGVILVTTATDTVALVATTCEVKWRHEYMRHRSPVFPVNRGVAYFGGRVFRGTDDGHLLALDVETGKLLWDSIVGDARLGEMVSGAPIAWNGLVIAGISGGDLGLRGRIVAFDALSGREVWRFHTIPSPEEVGANTWRDTDWQAHGGGGSWSHFAIDETTGEVFVPVGNPVPDFVPSERPGSNLFTNSVVVLDAFSGKLHWWYQITPTDGLDHDLGAAPMLYRNSRGESMVAAAGKDGYLYLISRTSHKLIARAAVTTADALPVMPTPEGVRSCPGIEGGVEWNGPAFDPVTNTVFVGAVDWCSIFASKPGTPWKPGTTAYGGTWRPSSLEAPTGWITAVDADNGAIRWKFHARSPVLGGLTPTAGGVLLGSDNSGNLYAFDIVSGKRLVTLDVGGSVSGGVVTFEHGGRQYVAVTAGNVSRSMYGAVGRPSVVVLALKTDSGGGAPDSAGLLVTRGKTAYMESCFACHGTDGRNIQGADLSTVHERRTLDQIEAWIKNPAPPMPKVFPQPLESEDEATIHAIAAYLSAL